MLRHDNMDDFIVSNHDEINQTIFFKFHAMVTDYEKLQQIEKQSTRFFVDFLKLIFQRVSFAYIYNLADNTEIFNKQMRNDFTSSEEHINHSFKKIYKDNIKLSNEVQELRSQIKELKELLEKRIQ